MIKETWVPRRVHDDGSAYGCIRFEGQRFYPRHPSDVIYIGDNVEVRRVAPGLIAVRDAARRAIAEESWVATS